jgi:2-oxoisovalerate dehydrogenase E1 component
MNNDDRLEMYRRMFTIRRFEERVAELYRDGEIPGFVHLSIGQEASAVGACWSLSNDDVITSTHRGHGHCLAKGLDVAGMVAELMARETGTNHGRGGSMHVADPSLGIFGANGIVGAGMPIAVGSATAQKVAQSNQVTVAFFGDGAVAQGTFHESVNLAGVDRLPLIFFCENNGWAEFSSVAVQHRAPLSARAAGYGIEFYSVDGLDVEAVAELMMAVISKVRAGGGPIMIEASTFRARGHYEGDAQKYRSNESDENLDPVRNLRTKLLSRGVVEKSIADIEAIVENTLADAIDNARSAPVPNPDSVLDHVISPRTKVEEVEAFLPDETWRMMDALHQAMSDEMREDPTVFLVGVDIAEAPFAITRGLIDTFGPQRVRSTPISESAVIGTAVGASLGGYRPIAEIMYVDFIGVCFDQLMNQAAKLRYMTGGNATLPLVVRTQFGAGRSSGSQHSQSLEVLLAHIPGLTVVMPSNPADAYGLLRSAIQDPNPVIFIEHRLTYGMKGPRVTSEHRVPLGRARVAREGSDVTLVSYSRMVHEALKAADLLQTEGLSVEVIDLRTVAPIDWETIERSVQKTSRLVVAHEAVITHGLGAEIAAHAASEWFWSLDAPVVRVAAEFSPPPYAPGVEQRWLPNAEKIAIAVRSVLRG